MDNSPLFLLRADRHGYTFVDTGLISSFTVDGYPPAADAEDRTGALLTFSLTSSTSQQVVRIFRDRSLIATISSDQADLTQDQLYIDLGAPFGQTVNYYLEVFRYDTEPQYQYMQLGYTMPAVAPESSVISGITVLSDSSDSTMKSIELSYQYDPQAHLSRNPTHFLITITDGGTTLFRHKSEFSVYRYSYKHTINFHVKSDTTSVDVNVAAVRGTLSSVATQAQAVNQFNLLPAPTITFSDLSTRFVYTDMQTPRPSYGFKVTLSMPAGLDDIDSFEIVPVSSSRYFDKVVVTAASNTFSFTEDNIAVTSFPGYTVTPIKGDSRGPSTTKQFSLTDINMTTLGSTFDEAKEILQSFLDNQELIAKSDSDHNPLPSALGTPALGVYYQGSTFADWLNSRSTTQVVSYLRQAETSFQFAKGTGSPLMWKQQDYSALFFSATREYSPAVITNYANVANTNMSIQVGGDKLAAQQLIWTDKPLKADGVTPETNAIRSVQLYLGYESGPGEELYVDIYSNYVGGDGNDYPGTRLSTESAKMDGHTTTDPQYYTFEFPSYVPVELNTKYWIVAWSSPCLTTYRLFGYTSDTLPQTDPFTGGGAAYQLSSNRLKVFTETERLVYQGMTYREAVIASMSTLPIAGSVTAVDGVVTEAPELLTNPDTVNNLDLFLNRLQAELGMTDAPYDGPCMLFESFPSTEMQTNFVDGQTELVTSSVRIGNLKFNYGSRTNITRVSDVAAKINTTSLYKAVVLCNATLNGGELTNLFDDTVYVAGDGETAVSEDDIVPSGVESEVSFAIGGVINQDPHTHQSYDGAYIVRMSKMLGRYTENTKIRIMPPFEAGPDAPWYPRINAGRFSVYKNNRIFEYSIAEFPFQAWSQRLGAPYKDVWSETPRILDSTTLQLSRYPVTDTQYVHLLVNGRIWNQFVADVDLENGVVLLSKELPDNPVILVDYIYTETCYEYPLIDLNTGKRFSSTLAGKYVGIFLSQVQGDAPETDSNLFFTDPTELERWFGRRRTLFHRVFDTVDDLEAFAASAANEFLYLLGYYHLAESDIRNTNVRDARRRGGGLVETMTSTQAFDKHKGSRGFYDIGYNDGEPFSECNVVIRLPMYLQERLDQDYIMTLAKKYLAYGVLPIVTFYDGIAVDVSNPDSRVVFPLPENVPSNQLIGYGVSYGEIYGLK